MSPTPAAPLARERKLILAALLALAAAWALVLWQAAGMGGATMGPTMGLRAPLFLALWVAMMVAMMFPTAAPMILMFATVARGKRQRGQVARPTGVFVGAYLALWALFGGLAYAAAVAGERLAAHSMWLMAHAGQLGGSANFVGVVPTVPVLAVYSIRPQILARARTAEYSCWTE